MQVTTEKEKSYLKEIENLLICDKKKKNEILDSFGNEVDNFLNYNPETDYEELLEIFGTPQEVAQEILASEPVENIKKRVNVAKWIKVGIVSTILLIVFCYIAALSITLIDAHMSYRGYFEEYIVDCETGEVKQVPVDE